IFDRCLLNPEDLADERHDTRQMSACLAREDLSQSILLILVCTFVHIKGNLPFALHHVTRRLDRKHGVKSAQIDLAIATLVDVPGNQQSAVASCRWSQKDAWTRNVTITGFKIRSGNFPGSRHNGGLHFKR